MPEAAPLVEIPRTPRRIEAIIKDFRTDERNTSYSDQVAHYSKLKEMGLNSVSWEARMMRLIKPDRTFDSEVAKAYENSLKAMKEVGMNPSTVVLFTPEKWMVELAKSSPDEFKKLYRDYATEVKDIYKRAGAKMKYVQVMNEINTPFQTIFDIDQCVDMIKITKEVFHNEFPDAKIMTTLITDAGLPKTTGGQKDWQVWTKRLIEKAGNALDSIGFDYYPGTYWKTAIKIPRFITDARTILTAIKNQKDPTLALFIERNKNDLGYSNAFQAFGDVEPYKWVLDEKTKENGILRDKEIVFSETGAPAFGEDEKFQRFQKFGYERMVQSLSHLLSTYENDPKHPRKAEDLVAAIEFFTGAATPAVDTKFPGDFTPWTLLRKDAKGDWAPTEAAKQLKYLIQSRINGSV